MFYVRSPIFRLVDPFAIYVGVLKNASHFIFRPSTVQIINQHALFILASYLTTLFFSATQLLMTSIDDVRRLMNVMCATCVYNFSNSHPQPSSNLLCIYLNTTTAMYEWLLNNGIFQFLYNVGQGRMLRARTI